MRQQFPKSSAERAAARACSRFLAARARWASVKVVCKLTPERAAHPGFKRVSIPSVYARLVAFRDSIDAADVPGALW